jgi:hypothetical protein
VINIILFFFNYHHIIYYLNPLNFYLFYIFVDFTNHCFIFILIINGNFDRQKFYQYLSNQVFHLDFHKLLFIKFPHPLLFFIIITYYHLLYSIHTLGIFIFITFHNYFNNFNQMCL